MKRRIVWMVVGIAAILVWAGMARAEPQNADGKQPVGPIRARLLEKFDKDGDGKLSPEERQAAREALKERFAEKREKIIQKFDTDGDGKLSPEEKKAALDSLPPEVRQRIEERRQKILAEFDADGDGKLNDVERQTARETIRERIKDRLDRNGDGKVGPIEWWMGRRALHQHHDNGSDAGAPEPGDN